MSVKQIEGYNIYLQQVLGQGSYGSVYVGESKKGIKVAVKILRKANIDVDQYLRQALFSEIKIMQSIQSPNIVGFLDVMESNQNYYIIQELCDGDISKIMKPKIKINQEQSIKMLTQICNGFLALVKEGIVHRDLKPANIMIKGQTLKIGDFGFAKKSNNNQVKLKTVVGTPLYMSLEILKGQQYTSKCDIWALGFIFFEMLNGQTPWTAKTQHQLIQNIENKSFKLRRNDLQPNTIDFLNKCLQIREQKRISWDQLFAHPIFMGYFTENGQKKEFQNRIKTIMSDLRFWIKKQNLDLCKILYQMGYVNEKMELDFLKFRQLLKLVNQNIKEYEIQQIFKIADKNNNKRISIIDIENLMKQYSISLNSTFKHIPIFNREKQESFNYISPEIQTKIRNCFIKLQKIIKIKNLTLLRVFHDFDKQKKGSLNQKQFKIMLKKLSSEITDEQIHSAFNMIDEDNSQTIQFVQLNKYYSKVNGIPESMNKEQQYPKFLIQQSPQSQSNPWMQLFKGSIFPPTQIHPSYNPPMQYTHPSQQQQQQGIFNNYIMNQLHLQR